MPEPPTISLTTVEPGIAVLTLDMPDKSVNILSSSVLAELEAHLADLKHRDDLLGLIIASGKKGTFVVGADIRELTARLNVSSEQALEFSDRRQQLFARLCQCPFVTVATIDGACLGGGTELVAWCDRRLVSDSPKTVLGFPEVKLGIIPAWGGTVRAPRIVGLGNAVEMITSGEPIDARSAFAMGWASDIVPGQQLMPAAIRLIHAEQESSEYLRDRQRWSGPTNVSETEIEFLRTTSANSMSQATESQNPAPTVALRVMLDGARVASDRACQLEAAGVSQLLGTPVNSALINVYFLSARNRKDTGVDRTDVSRREISSVGVIGAGIMGAGIAAANVKHDIPVVLTDVDHDALRQGVREITDEMSFDKQANETTAERASQFASLLSASTSGAELAGCDMVIEAVVENVDAKKELYARIEPRLKPDAILASNTSTIPATRLAEGLQRPDRFCGIHFFNPVRRMRMAEVIRGEHTSDQTVATAVAYCKRVGKSPIVVNDSPGFVVNRLLSPYLNASLELVIEGARIEDIDRTATTFGMPLGPIALYDMVGMDTAMRAGRNMLESFPSRIIATPILPTLIKAGRLGQKQGLGFYSYQNKKKRPELDPELDRLLEPFVRNPDRRYSEEELTARLFMPMLLEATYLLQSHVVRDVRDIDLGMILGVGFPATKGGLLYWADSLGAARIIEMLKPLEHLGQRGQPTPMLREMAETGAKFYQQQRTG